MGNRRTPIVKCEIWFTLCFIFSAVTYISILWHISISPNWIDDIPQEIMSLENSSNLNRSNALAWEEIYISNDTDYPTVSPTSYPSASPTKKRAEDYIVERKFPPRTPVYLAIASVPRVGNTDYLLQVLNSLRELGYPANQVYVFFNGLQNETHVRWDQAHVMEFGRGSHFLWNEAPVPEPHPSIHNFSIPLPTYVNPDDSDIKMALGDSISRKNWRRKEFHDFLTISKYMLRLVYGNESREGQQRMEGILLQNEINKLSRHWNRTFLAPNVVMTNVSQKDVIKFQNQRYQNQIRKIKRQFRLAERRRLEQLDSTWIIFNQDDGMWKVNFYTVLSILETIDAKVIDFFGSGLVSIGFRAGFLSRLILYGESWMDFKPVDWMLKDYVQIVEPTVVFNYDAVSHIGDISSRIGRIENIDIDDTPEVQELKSRLQMDPIPTEFPSSSPIITTAPSSKPISTDPPTMVFNFTESNNRTRKQRNVKVQNNLVTMIQQSDVTINQTLEQYQRNKRKQIHPLLRWNNISQQHLLPHMAIEIRTLNESMPNTSIHVETRSNYYNVNQNVSSLPNIINKSVPLRSIQMDEQTPNSTSFNTSSHDSIASDFNMKQIHGSHQLTQKPSSIRNNKSPSEAINQTWNIPQDHLTQLLYNTSNKHVRKESV
jgi:hypothetical protein